MTESSGLGRREFLAGTTGLVTAGLLHRSASAQDSPAAPFVQQSQKLPTPPVQLPTDRLPSPEGRRKRIVALTTTWWKYSHADDIITKFIEGYAVVGRTHVPHCQVVGLYVEQFPDTDISRGMAARYGIRMYNSPAEALTLGGDELAADAVLLVGEHGDYPFNEKGQHLYPRRRLFEEIVNVFRKSGRSVPVFNDKHLSFSWENAEWMYRQARELKFPLMAGSSLPVTWREPPLAFRRGIPLQHALVASAGSFESYGFHCLEFLQTFVEKRIEGETGVKAVQALEGDAANQLIEQYWDSGLIPAAIETVPAAGKNVSKRNQGKNVVFRVEYADGLEAAVCLTGGLVTEASFAARVAGRPDPVATCCLLPIPQRDHFSFLCNHVEYMFRSGQSSYPVERTLLTTGILDALHDSRQAGGKLVPTPHLQELSYTPAEDYPTSS